MNITISPEAAEDFGCTAEVISISTAPYGDGTRTSYLIRAAGNAYYTFSGLEYDEISYYTAKESEYNSYSETNHSPAGEANVYLAEVYLYEYAGIYQSSPNRHHTRSTEITNLIAHFKKAPGTGRPMCARASGSILCRSGSIVADR